MPTTSLTNWMKPEYIKTAEYASLRDSIIDFEKKFRVHVIIDVEYWNDLPSGASK